VDGSAHARSRLIRSGVVGLAFALLSVGLTFIPGSLDGFERRTWDWRVRALAKPGKATSEISLILLDQQSLDWGEEAYQFRLSRNPA